MARDNEWQCSFHNQDGELLAKEEASANNNPTAQNAAMMKAQSDVSDRLTDEEELRLHCRKLG